METMPESQSARDPLLQAIVDFRLELDRVIAEQVVALGQAADRPARGGLERTTVEAAATALPGPRVKKAPRTSLGDRGQLASSSGAVPDQAEPAESGRGEDPRQRLNALAKRLDGRLRRVNGTSASQPAPSGE
jgi:hypothetical protein